jgi:multiple sugar transport system permease protein
MMRKSWQAYLFLAPLMLGCMVFYIIPFVQVIQFSLTWGGSLSLKNYQELLLRNGSFVLAFGNSMKFLLAGLPLVMVLAYLIAILLKQQANRHKFLKTVFMLPYIMPVAGTVLLVDVVFQETGLLNRFLTLLNGAGVDWLNGPSAFWVMILLYLWKNTGYAVILLLAGLVTIPEDQYESAELDGATALQKFHYITTPQMWYAIFFALAFSVINGFKCFREIFLIGGQEPDDELYMLQHFINNTFKNLNYPKLSAGSVLLLAVIFLFFVVLYGFVQRKEQYRE